MKKHNTIKVVLLVVTVLLLLSAVFLPDKDWGILVKSALCLTELFLIIFTLKDKQNTLKVVLATTIGLMLLSWILPAAVYQNQYLDQGRVQMGLFDFFNYPLTVFYYFGFLVLFVMMVGGFYGILNKIPAYRSFLDKVANAFKKNGMLSLSVMIILLAALTSVCGLQYGILVFFPMLASIILLMGYDKIVVALTLVGSTMVGVIGTTYGYNTVGILNTALGLDISDNIFVKVIILLAGLVLLIFNIFMYIKSAKSNNKGALKAEKLVVKTEDVPAAKTSKVEDTKKAPAAEKKIGAKRDSKTTKSTTKGASKNATKSTSKSTGAGKKKTSTKASRSDLKAASKGDEVIVVKESLGDNSLADFVPAATSSKHKVWPIVTLFVLLFVIVVLAFTPWLSSFGVDAFDKASEAVTEFELFEFPIFAKLFGQFNSFGSWSLTELCLVMVVMALLLSVIYKVKADDFYEGFVNGVKKALVPTLIVILIHVCLVISVFHPVQLVIYKAIFSLTKGFNVVTSTLVAMLAGLFNADPSYAFQAAVPYAMSVAGNADVYPVMGILYSSIYGLTMLVAPTSLILATVLSTLGVSFKEWFKSVWKLFLELLVVLLIVFVILVLI